MTKTLRSILPVLAFLCVATSVRAQTIYPIDRADILAGSRFDVKVEVPSDAGDVVLTINGKDAAKVTGIKADVISNEDGSNRSALWLRDVSVSEPGTYEVTAKTASASQSVTWNVYSANVRKARNVILFIGDGMSVAHRTAARILSKGISQGKYNGKLAIDDMPYMALVSTAGQDSVITDSANSMSAYATGHKSCVGAIGVYCASNADPLAHPRVENLTSLAKRNGNLAVGIVTTSELTDATPAGMVAHSRRRTEMLSIARMMFEAKPDVMLGGGSLQFLPADAGGLRTDGVNIVEDFKRDGYAFADTSAGMLASSSDPGVRKLFGVFNAKDIDGALDRKFLHKGTTGAYPNQPDLTEQTKAALDVLSRSENGFLLMVESARIDKYSHSLDWERAVYDTIMLDKAVEVAKEFARDRNDTMIVVVADHAHPLSIVGTFDDAKGGASPRTKLSVYGEAGYPNYPAPDTQGYPPTPDVSRRLAVLFGTYPDHCFSDKPSLDGEVKPGVPRPGTDVGAADGGCRPGTFRLFGNLPFDAPQGVHAGDDVILTAMGPGAELFHGQIDNTYVFRVIAEALGLGGSAPNCSGSSCTAAAHDGQQLAR